jgi:hypothetical protein
MIPKLGTLKLQSSEATEKTKPKYQKEHNAKHVWDLGAGESDMRRISAEALQ